MTKQFDELFAEIVKPHVMELTPPPEVILNLSNLTPAAWLAMLPGVVAQLPVEQHEEFVTNLLRQLDRLGVEMAGCVADEFVVARNWF